MKALISIPQPARAPALEKALWAMTRAQTHHVRTERTKVAQMVYADDKIVNEIIERGTAAIGTTGVSGWASQLTQNPVGEFLATLAPLSAAAQIIAQGLQVRMGANLSMKLPARVGAPSTTVSWIGEGDPAPVRSYTIGDDCELEPKKFGFLIGISGSLAKRASGEAVVRQLMREDAAATLDAAYFSTTSADAATHAGMLNGVSPLTGYAGGDKEALETDLIALSDVVSPAGSGQIVYVVSPKRAARLRVKAPDINRENTFLPSLAVADTTIVAVDPASWAHGFSDEFYVEASNAATLHMSDTPAEIVSSTGPTAADPVRSMWQTDSIAMRLLADVAFASRRPNAVAWLEGATW